MVRSQTVGGTIQLRAHEQMSGRPGFGHRKNPAQEFQAARLLEFFFPVHYKVGVSLEDALRSGTLTRKQTAILWLIRSEGRDGVSMNRKEILRLLTSWFEVSSPGVSKALRAMAAKPLKLIRIIEDPKSGRERRVVLTAKGKRFIEAMTRRGRDFLTEVVAHLSDEEVEQGINFFGEVFRLAPSSRGGSWRIQPTRSAMKRRKLPSVLSEVADGDQSRGR